MSSNGHTARGWTLKGSTGRFRRIDLNARGEEKQHFLLTAAACTVGLLEIADMTDDEAYDTFKAIRFSENNGEPFCPHCGSTLTYDLLIQRRTKGGPVPTKLFKCGEGNCRKQFSLTSCTTFAGRKMSIRKILFAILVFVDGASGAAALRLRRDIKCSYKTAFVLTHKLREAIASSRDPRPLRGMVEVDGMILKAHHRQANLKKDRKNNGGTRFATEEDYVVVTARERGRGGESRVFVVRRDEARAAPLVLEAVAPDAMLITDEGNWPGFHRHEWKTVKHKEGLVVDGVHTNGVESHHNRTRRALRGVHYRIRDKNLDLYVQEMSWREDFRHTDNGEQWRRITNAATHHPVSKRFKGYWERGRLGDAPRRQRRAKPCVAA
jgi:transposase-like protein